MFLKNDNERNVELRTTMMSALKRENIGEEVYFNSIHETRFKTMKITAAAFLPLAEETAAQNALLAQILTRSCAAYPSLRSLEKKLRSLYGAVLYSDVRKIGDRQCLSFSVSGLDDQYAFDQTQISAELTKLLCSILFKPNTEDNCFLQTELAQSKRQLTDLMDSEFNDKRIYAVSSCIKLMCEGTPFGIERFGTRDNVEQTDGKTLYHAWESMLKQARFEIICVGASDMSKAKSIFAEAFSKIRRTPAVLSNDCLQAGTEVKSRTEEMELAQSKLVMGLTAGAAFPDSRAFTLMLLSAVLGGTPNSKLFANVREKQSLCYYCVSRYNGNKGYILIESGVEGKNLEKAQAAILREMEEMKSGNITDFEIQSAKLALENSLRSVTDTVSGIEAFYLSRILEEEQLEPREIAERINKVTKEQLVEAAEHLRLDTVYILKNKE